MPWRRQTRDLKEGGGRNPSPRVPLLQEKIEVHWPQAKMSNFATCCLFWPVSLNFGNPIGASPMDGGHYDSLLCNNKSPYPISRPVSCNALFLWRVLPHHCEFAGTGFLWILLIPFFFHFRNRRGEGAQLKLTTLSNRGAGSFNGCVTWNMRGPHDYESRSRRN